jgi:large subunit ribosomal protein L24
MPSRIRKGDTVAVVSGADKGKRGKVLRVMPDEGRVLVEGVNLVYKHMRRSQKSPQGGRIRRESPVHASKVMPVDPKTNEPSRVSYVDASGRRGRFGRKSRVSLDAEGPRKGARKGAQSSEKAATEKAPAEKPAKKEKE